jgi:rod shape determining protein RodA
MNTKQPLDFDLTLFISAMLLVVVGILFIYSSGTTSTGLIYSNEYIKQIVWACLGTGLLFAVSLVDYRKMKDFGTYFYFGVFALLLYSRIFGRVVNGARAWIGIGDIGLEPSEFMKIATIIYLASFLEDSANRYNPVFRFLISFAIVGGPILLIMSQPDLGTALVFFPIFLIMTFIAGCRPRYILFMMLTGFSTIFFTILPLFEKYIVKRSVAVFSIFTEPSLVKYTILTIAIVLILSLCGYLFFKKRYYYWIVYSSLIVSLGLIAGSLANTVLKEYQIMRLIVFLNPEIDPKGSGWNIIQSITAIGSGGFFGKGFLQGTQSHYRYLPQQSTDFIFSIISEEWGFIGGLIVFGLYFAITYRGVKIASTVKDPFAVYIASGIVGMFLFHFLLNIGMVMGIMPIAGIPLFFVSYGGSALWTALISVGFLISMYSRRFRY